MKEKSKIQGGIVKRLIVFFASLLCFVIIGSNAQTGITTIAGWISFDDNYLTLNGRRILPIAAYVDLEYPPEFQFLHRSHDRDITYFQIIELGGSRSEGHSYIYILVLSHDGEFQIFSIDYDLSSAWTKKKELDKSLSERKFSLEGDKIIIGKQVINRSSRGNSPNYSFYEFLEKFRSDRDFQLSRTIFPFKLLMMDVFTGDTESTVSINRNEWKHKDFKSQGPYDWDEPRIVEEKAFISMSQDGTGIKILYIFEYIQGKWYLARSEDWST